MNWICKTHSLLPIQTPKLRDIARHLVFSDAISHFNQRIWMLLTAMLRFLDGAYEDVQVMPARFGGG